MPLAASLKLSNIAGTGVQKEREGDITVVGFRHEVESDLDPKSGHPTDDRTHRAFVILKNLDIATPALHEAHAANTKFGTWILRLFHMPRSGPEAHYFTVALTEARIASIKLVMPDLTSGVEDPDYSNVHEYEEVAFFYESIAWANSPPAKPNTSTDTLVKFAPDWIEEEAKRGFDKLVDAAKEKAQAEFDKELKEKLEKYKK